MTPTQQQYSFALRYLTAPCSEEQMQALTDAQLMGSSAQSYPPTDQMLATKLGITLDESIALQAQLCAYGLMYPSRGYYRTPRYYLLEPGYAYLILVRMSQPVSPSAVLCRIPRSTYAGDRISLTAALNFLVTLGLATTPDHGATFAVADPAPPNVAPVDMPIVPGSPNLPPPWSADETTFTPITPEAAPLGAPALEMEPAMPAFGTPEPPWVPVEPGPQEDDGNATSPSWITGI